MKRKLRSLLAVFLSAITLFTVGGCTSCGEEGAKASAFVTVDINPSIELVLDEENKVMSVRGSNEDGMVLLYQEEGIVGADVETAVGKIASLAVELGYLDENNKVVQTSLSGTVKDGEKLLKDINASITASAEKLDLNVSVSGEAAYSILRQLDALKAKYPNNQAIQNLTPEKLRLVVAVSETGEISIEAAASLSVEELIKKANVVYEKTSAFATDAYLFAKATASNIYDQAAALALDGIYTGYYMAHRPLEAYYGVAYQGFKTTERTFRGLATVLAEMEKVRAVPLNDAQIEAVKVALNVTDVTLLKNSNGEVTIASVEAYADKLFKNSQTSAEIEEIKAQLTLALNNAQRIIEEQIEIAKQEYQEEIETVKEALASAQDGIEKVLLLIPEGLRGTFDAVVKDYADVVNAVFEIAKDGRITAAEVFELSEKAGAKAMAAKAVMDVNLTDNDKAKIAELQASAEKTLASAKEKMESAILEAEAQAKAHIEAMKNARKN